MKNLIVRSYAKINICLNVTGKRPDGYHTLDMVMLPLQMHDTLIVSELKKAVDNFVTIDDFSCGCIDYNIATIALNELASIKGYDNKFRISIHKTIPMQAGLGGGSSNAAAALMAVNQYLKLGCSQQELANLSAKLGADVPFFIYNKPMRCSGVGDIMEPVEVKNNYWALIVKPSAGCSTRVVYEKCDSMTLKTCDVDKVIEALASGDDEELADSIENSLQTPAICLVPEIENIIELLKSKGLKIVQMSGSGSAVFALSTDKKLITSIANELEEQDKYFVELTKVIK